MTDPRHERKTTRENEGRQKRVPLGLQRNTKLAAFTPDGYVGRWMNDEGNRINDAMAGGWVFMKDKKPVGEGAINLDSDLGSCTSQIVGTKEDGSPLRAYWMLLKKEWYEEDKQAKLKPVDEIEKAIKGGTVGQESMQAVDRDARYVPKTGIKIQ